MSSSPAAFEFLTLTLYEVTASPHFAAWLHDAEISIAFSNSDHLYMVGLKADGALAISRTKFTRCMGLARAGNSTLYLATEYQIWRLENGVPPGQRTENGCDALYLPQSAYTTGHLGIYDLAVDAQGQIIFANTLLSCLATVSDKYNFVPLWLPPFVPNLAAVDHCHLNGLAMRDGKPAYVTSASQTSGDKSWQKTKRDGGVITDVARNQVVVEGLAMPHSPRWYRDSLWLTNSGTGEFGRADFKRGRFEPMVFAPGFLRGLDFVGRYVIIGSSYTGSNELYEGLPLENVLREKQLRARHGLYIVDLETGELAHWLYFDGLSRELYSVAALPGVRHPMSVESDGEEIQELVTVGTGRNAT